MYLASAHGPVFRHSGRARLMTQGLRRLQGRRSASRVNLIPRRRARAVAKLGRNVLRPGEGCRSEDDTPRGFRAPEPGEAAGSPAETLLRHDFELLRNLDDRGDRAVEVFAGEGGADLAPESDGALGDDGEAEAADVNAAVEELGGHGDRFRGVADQDRDDRVDAFADADAALRELLAEVRGVLAEAGDEGRVLLEDVERGEG